MDDAMVTGRISAEKKAAGNAVLERAGLTASQAINLLYDRLIEDGDAEFLTASEVTPGRWKSAVELIRSVHVPISGEFDNMTRGEIKLARAKARGII